MRRKKARNSDANAPAYAGQWQNARGEGTEAQEETAMGKAFKSGEQVQRAKNRVRDKRASKLTTHHEHISYTNIKPDLGAITKKLWGFREGHGRQFLTKGRSNRFSVSRTKGGTAITDREKASYGKRATQSRVSEGVSLSHANKRTNR